MSLLLEFVKLLLSVPRAEGSPSSTSLLRIGQLSMFCSQAYGAGNLPLVGTWLQIYLVFTTLVGLPSVSAWEPTFTLQTADKHRTCRHTFRDLA